MTYNTIPRTRQAVYAATILFAAALLFTTAWHWTDTRERGDVIIALWVVSVAWATFKILRGLERLELSRAEPDEAMELLLYAASVLPIAGYVPILFHLGSR